jgi:SNF2 family DNA or RNA helicase
MGATPVSETRIRWGLTGTPVSNSLMDLWSLLHFIDPEEWPSRVKYSDRMFNIMTNMFHRVIACDVKPERRAEWEATVLPRMRRVPLDAVVKNLPDVLVERRDVEMSAKQQKAYKSMADTLIASLDTGVLIADSPMVAAMRLLQISSSYGEVEETTRSDGSISAHLILSDPSSKLDAFMDMLEDLEGRTIAVFAVSRQLLMLLSKRLEAREIPHGLIVGNQREWERQTAIDEFQQGKTKMILVGYAAGGTGVTLTAADTMITLQRPWSQIEWKQAQARCRRIGSEVHDHITRIDLVTPGTLEEAVFSALENKGLILEELVKDREVLEAAVNYPPLKGRACSRTRHWL